MSKDKDYRTNITQDDCKIFECKCDDKTFRVVAANGSDAIDILKKYHKGDGYHSKWSGRYLASMLNSESDAILKD